MKHLLLIFCSLILALAINFVFTGQSFNCAYARSALSPRHSGLEPPGGPRPLEAIPGNSPGRTPEGGRGYTDAYGNTVRNTPPAEKEQRRRPSPGAYGGYGKKDSQGRIPDPANSPRPPVWSFQ